MCYAQIAANLITAYSRALFRSGGDETASLIVQDGSLIDAFDHCGQHSRQHVATDLFNEQLGVAECDGVCGAYIMGDGSYLLTTYTRDLAWWSGDEWEPAHWQELPEQPIF